MKDTLIHIITGIVDSPKDVSIREENVDGTDTFFISVAKDDVGKVIGKGGKVIRAIRNVLKIQAMKENRRINISLEETE
jgi:predicted RNA-binding protein YlqC (UPF0109 family)